MGTQKTFSVNKEASKTLGIFQEYVATEQGFFGLQFYLFIASTNWSRIFFKIKALADFVLWKSENNN